MRLPEPITLEPQNIGTPFPFGKFAKSSPVTKALYAVETGLVDYAKIYLAAGLRPFPVISNRKTPAIAGGFHSAATTSEQCEKLFGNH